MSEYAIVPTTESANLSQEYTIIFAVQRVTSWTPYTDAQGRQIPCTVETYIGLEEPDGFTQAQITEIEHLGGTRFHDNTAFITWRDEFSVNSTL